MKSKWSFAWLKGKKSINKKTAVFLTFAGLSAFAVIFLIAWLYHSVAQKQSVLHFLPESETTAYVELENLSGPSGFRADLTSMEKALTSMAELHFGLEMAPLKPYLSDGPMGVAFLHAEKTHHPLLFFKPKNHKKTLNYLKSIALKDETLEVSEKEGQFFYRYPQSHSFSFAFMGPYLFMARSFEPLHLIHQVQQGRLPYLKKHTAYQKSLTHLPRNAWLNGYVHFSEFSFEQYPAYQPLFHPLKSLIDHLGITIRQRPWGLQFNTLLSTSSLPLKNPGVPDNGFNYELASLIPPKTLGVYFGGSNLTAEWQNTLDSISQLNPAYGLILEGLIRAQVNRIFGTEVSLRNDLYPLFEEEYALTFHQPDPAESDSSSSSMGVALILRHTDADFTTVKLQKMMKGFEFLAAQFSPAVKTFTLPDNTEARELIADYTKINEVNEDYKGVPIKCLEVSESAYHFCYAVGSQFTMLSNRAYLIKQSIDLAENSSKSLAQSDEFKRTLNQLSKVNNEISYVHTDHLKKLLSPTRFGPWTHYLPESFHTIGWVKHYFDDGVSTEGMVLFK